MKRENLVLTLDPKITFNGNGFPRTTTTEQIIFGCCSRIEFSTWFIELLYFENLTILCIFESAQIVDEVFIRTTARKTAEGEGAKIKHERMQTKHGRHSIGNSL